MSMLFVTRPGQVVAFSEVGVLPLTIFLEGWPGYPSMRAAITQVSAQSMGNFQFLHTLKDFIYVYIFGERIGEMMISGVAFSESCQGAGNSGPEQISQYYNQYRISKYGQLLSIQIGLSGASRVRGFLTGFQMAVVDAEHQLSQFSMRFNTFAPEANRAN